MLLLPNGCKCSELRIHPKNWATANADMHTQWYVHYRFYDPTTSAPKQVKIRGMNRFADLATRREFAKALLRMELERLKAGYNPFNSQIDLSSDESPDVPVHGAMGLIAALDQAVDLLKAERCTIASARSVVRGMAKASRILHLHDRPIGQVTRKDIKLLLEKCGETNTRWSDNQYNVYRRNLSMLYRILIEFEAVETNPIKDLAARRHHHKARRTLTFEERQKVSTHLESQHHRFWLYMQIFFHSGSRTTELFQIRRRDVDLAAGMFRVTVKKGRDSREQWRPIKDIALEYWRLASDGAEAQQYLFGPGFRPGNRPLEPNRVSRIWKALVKELPAEGGLGIDVDFYALKHLNLDETAAQLSVHAAAAQAGHTTPVITLKHYVHGEAARQAERLKKVDNKFA